MSPRTQGLVVLEVTRDLLGKALRAVRQNLVAYLALFFAIGGTAMAAKPLITGADIEDDSLTGADVNESTLGTVPRATDAVNAQNAANASLLDNQPSSAFAPSAVEPFHNVGDPGEPEFLNGWVPETPCCYEATAFYKDPWGVVHLKGVVRNDGECVPYATSAIFALPEGYRPTEGWSFQVGSYITVTISPETGWVTAPWCSGSVLLDGITFRAGY